jgi:nicotinamide mononucleotide transporter
MLEPVAALFGVIAVYLSAREKVLSWPTALVNVGLYAVVFRDQRLYADMGLQVVYFLLSVYGWYEWLHGGAQRTPLRVTRLTPRLGIVLLVLNLVAWVILASWLDRSTDAALPWLDALLSTTSLCAQFLMTRKVLENWLVWIVLDLVYVPMFLSRGMVTTAVLYAIFLVLALLGWQSWRASWHSPAAPQPS